MPKAAMLWEHQELAGHSAVGGVVSPSTWIRDRGSVRGVGCQTERQGSANGCPMRSRCCSRATSMTVRLWGRTATWSSPATTRDSLPPRQHLQLPGEARGRLGTRKPLCRRAVAWQPAEHRGCSVFANQTLSDDFYADFTPTAWQPNHDLYIPDMAVGGWSRRPRRSSPRSTLPWRMGQVNAAAAAASGYSFIIDTGRQSADLWAADGFRRTAPWCARSLSVCGPAHQDAVPGVRCRGHQRTRQPLRFPGARSHCDACDRGGLRCRRSEPGG